jgi:hypothetical protein
MEDVATIYGHLVYVTAIWYGLLHFGIFYENLVHSPPPRFLCCCKKNLATLSRSRVHKLESGVYIRGRKF